MSKIIIFAKVTAKKDSVDFVLSELKKLVPLVRKEPGCEAYILHQDVEKPEEFHFYEVWADQKALDVHSTAEALTNYAKATEGRVLGLDVTTTKLVM